MSVQNSPSLDSQGNIISVDSGFIPSEFAEVKHTHSLEDIENIETELGEKVAEKVGIEGAIIQADILGGVATEGNTLEKIYALLITLGNNAVKKISQSLTSAEKTQVRDNIDVFSKVESDGRYIQDSEYVHTEENFSTAHLATLSNLKAGTSGYSNVSAMTYNDEGLLVSFIGDTVLHTLEYNDNGQVIRVTDGAEEDIYTYNDDEQIVGIVTNIL